MLKIAISRPPTLLRQSIADNDHEPVLLTRCLLRTANRGRKPRSAALSTKPGEKYGFGRSDLNCPHGVRRYDAMVFKEETLAEATKKSPPSIFFEILVNFYKK